MKLWRVVFTKQAQKDARRLDSAGLRPKAERVLDILAEDACRTPPAVEKLVGDLKESYSRRINLQHRLVYQVIEDDRRRQSVKNVDPLRVSLAKTSTGPAKPGL